MKLKVALRWIGWVFIGVATVASGSTVAAGAAVAFGSTVAAGAAVSSGASVGAPDPARFTVGDLLRLQHISDPQVSPDGRYLAFTVSVPDLEKNSIPDALWLLQIDTGALRRISPEGAVDWSARWAPNGKSFYFLSARSGSAQVWGFDLATGTAVPVTHLPLDVNTFKVSPRGDRLLVSIDVFADCSDLQCTVNRVAEESGADRARMYDRLFIRHWKSWSDGRQSHLFSVKLGSDVSLSVPVDLTRTLDADVPSKPRGGDEEFDFSADGSRVAFTARLKGSSEAWSTNFDVYETAADGSGEPRNLTGDNPAWDTEPRYSADGRFLAWKAMDRPQHEADRFHLMLRDLKTGTVRALTGDWDRSIGDFAFARDSRRVFVTTDHLGQRALWSVDLAHGKPTLLHGQGQVTGFSASRDTLVFALGALDAPDDLYRLDSKGGSPRRLTRMNAALLESRRLSKFESFSFEGWNGEPVSGFVVQPFGLEPGHKYPVALIVHGGPELSYGNLWHYRWNQQIYAAAGYAVIAIDFHGSTGYGQAFTDSIGGDWGGKPLEDLQRGLAAALARYPWLDGTRVCALGASYGGYVMNWIEGTMPDTFRCLVNLAGPFDLRELYYATDEIWLDEWHHGGPQFANPNSYESQNPVNTVARWRTPMLVVHGQQDFNVAFDQGVATFTALQRRGIASRFVVFPEEGHFVEKPRDVLLWYQEVLAWLDRWLEPTERPKG